ncbi:D-aminoacyl-tRNA deacylase [Alloprevotella tannerae]|jgi:D-tyrosyl-tRNA(Tyr) deacylase|uniref:D-aminoacyl-tRNA deacylase n=1 Tax=Alloprevotella tannerae TaxID=76122 RepID=UPI001CB04499|nr:D-aminoacyl-tRNA deacylase [Alloprevotella tannerae]MBF0952005.1 D-tyrosyl-tRNA(Tyr) deacylase [Alloprevotella tannerae]
MKTVIQRVKYASVSIDGKVTARIDQGLMILLGIADDDDREAADWLARKAAALRIFDDENGVMNKDIQEIDGQILVVSQFTLLASYKKGNRPSYIHAAGHETAIPLYEYFIAQLAALTGKPVATGTFGADMKIELLNDGPVTICMDTKHKE